MSKKISKKDLFIELASPNKKGISGWVDVSCFTGKYSPLALGNGASWCRKESNLCKEYKVKFDKKQTPGNKIDRIKLNGKNTISNSSYPIRKDIKDEIKKRKCLILGTSNPECDHKNGLKNDPRVSNLSTQKLSDFQPLSKAANDAKRQDCIECKKHKIRFDATKLGYPISYYEGNATVDLTDINGCVGCFWYDPIEFRRHLKKK